MNCPVCATPMALAPFEIQELNKHEEMGPVYACAKCKMYFQAEKDITEDEDAN